MPTRGTRCRGIRDDQDEILVSQQGVCPGRDNPPHQSAANERASLGMETQTVLREHGRGPARRAWPDSEKASRTGTPHEAAVTVAKSKGVIKDTATKLYSPCPRVPTVDRQEKRCSLARPSGTRLHGQARGPGRWRGHRCIPSTSEAPAADLALDKHLLNGTEQSHLSRPGCRPRVATARRFTAKVVTRLKELKGVCGGA